MKIKKNKQHIELNSFYMKKEGSISKKQDIKIEADVSFLIKLKVYEVPDQIPTTKSLSKKVINRLMASVLEDYHSERNRLCIKGNHV